MLGFGAFAPLAPRLTRRVSIERVLLGCALLTAVAAGLRGAGGAAPLFAGCALAGLAVAIAQAVLPVFIRLRHPQLTGLLTGAYSMSLTLGATLAAALAVPLEDALGSWEASLAAWALPPLVAAVVWLPAARRPGTTVSGPPPPGLWRNRLAWNVSLFMGVQSMAFYAGLSWIPTVLEDAGFSEGEAGSLQALGALVQLVPAFALPVLATRSRDQIGLLLAIVGFSLAGVIGLIARAGGRARVDADLRHRPGRRARARADPAGAARRRRRVGGRADRDVAVRRLHGRGHGAVGARRGARRDGRLDGRAGGAGGDLRAGAGAGAARLARPDTGGEDVMETQVAIVGAGPAGLVLARLLELRGIDSVVLELRSREYVEERVRAGVLEQRTVDLLTEAGVADRLHREGMVHEGIELRFGGHGHRIDLSELTGGRTITVYGQQEVVKDLIAARLESGLDLRFEVSDVSVGGRGVRAAGRALHPRRRASTSCAAT